MRYQFLTIPVLAAVAAMLSGCSTTPKPAADGTVALFNGRDLTGWRSYLANHHLSTADVWSVQDGVIVCQGEPLGYLHTDRDYANFKLVVEWRWAPGKEPGNSGILMRINGEPRPLPRCIESQLKSGSAGDLYAFHEMGLGGDSERVQTIKDHALGGNLSGLARLATNEVAPGEWNRAEITVSGGNIVVLVNGVKVNEAAGAEILAGPIGLQSEGGEIHFRRVELTPLSLLP